MFLPEQYVACLFRKPLLAPYVIVFSMCFQCVLVVLLEVVLVCNKTVHRSLITRLASIYFNENLMLRNALRTRIYRRPRGISQCIQSALLR